MEQKILSLKDDKINSEVGLFEYPVELSGGRNLLDIPNYNLLMRNNENNVRVTTESFPDYGRVKRIPQDNEKFGNSNISCYTVYFYDTVIGEKYTESIKVNPEADITIALWYGQQTFCPAGVWTTLTYTYTATLTRSRYMGLFGGSFSPEFTPWISYKDLKAEKGTVATEYTVHPSKLGLSYPDFITEFKPSISDRYILTEELIEYPEELRGGRNLLTDSLRQSIYKENGTLGILTINHPDCPNGFYLVGAIDDSQRFRIDNLFSKVGTYTLSFEFRGSQGTSAITRVLIGTKQSPLFRGNANNDWLQFSFTAEITDLDNENYIKFFPAWVYAYYRNIKLEKGNKATDWSPAPEDLDLSYPDHIQSFGTSFSNNILINEFIEQ